MDNKQIAYPVFEISDVNQVTICLNEDDIKSFELNDFEVSGAKLVDSDGYEILVEGEAKESISSITRLINFFRAGQDITIKGRGERDLDKLKSIVLNFCHKNQIITTNDWDVLLQKIRAGIIIW